MVTMEPVRPTTTRLGDFISENLEEILSAWEDFARANWPRDRPDPKELRNNAAMMLRTLVADMGSRQTREEQKWKSEGRVEQGGEMDGSALQHARERLLSGYDIVMVVAEFRALRASVMRIWQASRPQPHADEVDELVRFHEAMDQLVSTSVETHSAQVDQGRKLFFGIVGHDLRQPLCSARLMASALVRAGAGVEVRPIAQKIQDTVDVMDALLRDMLDLGSARQGRTMAVYPASFDLQELAGEAMGEMETAHPAKHFALTCDGDLHGEWDGMRLRQMLSYLFENAVHHAGSSRDVNMALDGTHDDVTIRVTHHGRPVPPEVMGLLHEPLPRPVKGEEEGELPGGGGLGLFICREIARAHGGSIAVESPDADTTVLSVRLPRIAEQQNPKGATGRN
jgi:signal transduction histidine kinase